MLRPLSPVVEGTDASLISGERSPIEEEDMLTDLKPAQLRRYRDSMQKRGHNPVFVQRLDNAYHAVLNAESIEMVVGFAFDGHKIHCYVDGQEV